MPEFGLIGYPLGHSFSKKYFTGKFEKEALTDCTYENFPIENIDLLPEIIRNNPALAGLNVTIPYKLEVFKYLDGVEGPAKEIGAVNVVKINRENGIITTKGYNSDFYGFKQSLAPLLKHHHTHALILGTGGASKAVKFALASLGISYQFVSRTAGKAENCISYAQLNENIINSHKLIINTTPLGTAPNVETCPEIPYHFLGRDNLLYDLVYNPATTKFMQRGAAQGATCVNGLQMLHLQAEKAWEIWNS
ncbi:MAG: shikimate dehydrogenase [Bacteroidales bacterium]|nr:shikimate dehydrogenase [Bacteroidales bacterium]